MLSCQKCNFKILPKMRFALVKNFCPSCGGTLLSEIDSHEIGVINKKLQSQEFMISLSDQLNKDLVQNLIYDLSIFIKFDLKKEMSLVPRDSASNSIEADDSVDGGIEEHFAEEGGEGPKIPSKKISRVAGIASRQEDASPTKGLRRMSYSDNEPEDEYGDEDDSSDDSDEEIDDRVKRLKQLYKTSPTLRKFQGIARSDES